MIVVIMLDIYTDMLITTTSASFCASVGECQQKFLPGELFIQVGAFYSPNERFSPRIGLPSLNAIFPDTNERRFINIQMFSLI